MANVIPLKRQTNRAHFTSIVEGTDDVVMSSIARSSGGTAALWTDANVTTITIGGGGASTDVTIGRASQTVTMPGNLTVQGTATTLSTTNLIVADNMMLLNDGGNGADSGLAIERGVTGDDAVILWEEGNTRFELGLFDTAGGTTTPGAIATFVNMKVNNLLLDGTAVTADGALTVGATGSTNLQLTAQGTTYNVSSAGQALTTTATDIIGAINEVDAAAATAENLTATLTAGQLTGATPVEVSNAASGLISSAGVAATNPGTLLRIVAGAGNTTGAGAELRLEAGQGGTTGPGGDLNITSGDGGPTSGGSGDLAFDVGSVTSGTLGSITMGTVNALAVTLGRTGQATNITGTLNVAEAADFDAGMTIATGQSITGDGTLTMTNTGALTIGNGSTTSVDISQTGQTTNINGALVVDQTSTHTGVADFDAGMTVATGQAITGDGTLTMTNTGALNIGNGSTTTVSLSQTGQATAVAGSMTVAQTSTFTGVADFDAGITLASSQAITGDAAMSVTATGGTNDMTLGARGGTITLNESGQTTLTGFTATSIVGALNELVGGGGGGGTSVSLTNNSGVTIVEGAVVYHTTVDGEIDDSVATSDNTASRPVGFADAAILDTAAGDVILTGLATVRLVTTLTPTPGSEVFLSLTAGECTTDISAFSAGNVVQSVGIVSDDTNYAGSQTVEMIVQWGSRAVL